jgi:hypothetical protein
MGVGWCDGGIGSCRDVGMESHHEGRFGTSKREATRFLQCLDDFSGLLVVDQRAVVFMSIRSNGINSDNTNN